MPHLEYMDPTQAVQDFHNRYRMPNSHARIAQDVSIKTEDPTPSTNFEDEHKIHWRAAYKAFLAMVIGASRGYVFNLLSQDGQPTVLQIRGVISIALQIGAISSVQNYMESVLRKFQELR